MQEDERENEEAVTQGMLRGTSAVQKVDTFLHSTLPEARRFVELVVHARQVVPVALPNTP